MSTQQDTGNYCYEFKIGTRFNPVPGDAKYVICLFGTHSLHGEIQFLFFRLPGGAKAFSLGESPSRTTPHAVRKHEDVPRTH